MQTRLFGPPCLLLFICDVTPRDHCLQPLSWWEHDYIAFDEYYKYQGVKEFHMLARVGCCNIMVFSPFKVKVTYYHPLNLWLLGATSGNQGQTVMCLQCSETIKICLKLQIPYYHPLNLWLLGATNGNQGQTVMHL